LRWYRIFVAAGLGFVCAMAAPEFVVASPAFIVIDADAGTVLNQSQSDDIWYPASVTKVMTAYVTFKALKEGRLTLSSPVTISTNALAQAPSKMGFKVGTVLNVDNALKMMLVKSANDIAVAVAEAVGGNESDFVAMMNTEAKRLGMNSTRYDNPNGLPDNGHVTTVRDQAILARAVWADFPEYRAYFGIPAIKAGKRILRSQNALLERYRGTMGMKTGFICASGYNMIAAATRSGRTMIAVVFGASSSNQRNETAAHLLDQGFGTWFGANKPDLDTFHAGRTSIVPANLQDIVCGKRVKQEEDDGDTADAATNSPLGPRFTLMDPVPVYTGRVGADATAAEILPGAKMPLPRLRPKYAGADIQKMIQIETQ
jgi:D-alanyl-D-alanine carboxypeptidase